MPNLKSHYISSSGAGVGLVSISPLRDGWQKWNPFIGVQIGIKTGAGQQGIAKVKILKHLILILGLN